MNSETYRDLPEDIKRKLAGHVEIDESIPTGRIVHTVKRELSAQQLIDERRRAAKKRARRKMEKRNKATGRAAR